jgi:L-malate glycosyltransferase
MTQTRILHIIKGLGRGGAERLLVSTIGCHGDHLRFDVVYFLEKKDHLVQDLRARGCNVICLPSANVIAMLLRLPQLIRMIRKNRYQVLHAHLPWAGILARVAGYFTKLPVVYTEHNLFNRYNIITRFVSRLTFSWQSQVIAVSRQVKTVLDAEVEPDVPLRIITNGVDVSEFYRPAFDAAAFRKKMGLPHQLIIGTVTALTPQKRIDRWIEVAEKLCVQFPDVHFVIVGDGVLRNELEERAQALIASGRLRFTGITTEPSSWLACIDIFLMSSDFEGLPVAMLEAMSMECAVVTTNVGGIGEVIRHEKEGLLSPAEDVGQLIAHVSRMIRNPSERKTIGHDARQRVIEAFSVAAMVRNLESVYDDVLKKKRQQTRNDSVTA